MKFTQKNVLTLCAATALAAVIGCSNNGFTTPGSTGGGGGGTGLTAGGATLLFDVEQGASSSSIVQFGLANSSNLTPTATITAPSGVTFQAVATDSSGQIYVGAYTSAGVGEVLVYSAGSNGAATPVRTIVGGAYGSTTSFGLPYSMHVSSTGTLAILSYNGSINLLATMPASSNGTVTPTTLVQGSSTQLTNPDDVTVDQNGKVYVTNYDTSGSILEFAAGATGNAAPATVITTGTAQPYGIAADASGNVFTVLNPGAGTSAGSIAVFAAGASGAATPTRSISGSSTGIYYGGGLRLDSVGNVYIINETSASNLDFLAFPQSASGNVGPGLSFASNTVQSPTGEIAIR